MASDGCVLHVYVYDLAASARHRPSSSRKPKILIWWSGKSLKDVRFAGELQHILGLEDENRQQVMRSAPCGKKKSPHTSFKKDYHNQRFQANSLDQPKPKRFVPIYRLSSHRLLPRYVSSHRTSFLHEYKQGVKQTFFLFVWGCYSFGKLSRDNDVVTASRRTCPYLRKLT